MIARPLPTACEQCEAELVHRSVKLVLESGARHVFCSDSCERRWLIAGYETHRHALHDVHIHAPTNSRAYRIARAALFAKPANGVS